MTETDELELDINDESRSEDTSVPYSIREGVIFIIDATEPMFEIDPDTGTSYFTKCLEIYRNILSEKLSWNRTDLMGIILMGTNKWDQDPEIKNILTWLTFEQVSIDQMIKVEQALENVDKFHQEIGSSTNYPLCDALWHVTRCFNTVKKRLPFRSIVLLTCSDNPYPHDPAKKYHVRQRASDCSTLNIRLTVVGLRKEWNPEHFFKELEVLSGKFDRAEDYQRTFLTDLQEEVKHASRITNKLEWTLGNHVKLGVSVSTLIAKTKFPKMANLNKANNELLEAYSYYREEGSEDEDDDDDTVKEVLPKNVYKYQEFGNRNIKFSLAEVFKISNWREPGISLLGFKPLKILDLSCHLEAPKLITYDESKLIGSKNLFAALLKQCNAREVMAICVVTMRSRSASCLYAMIPNIAYSGFYAYKLPFAENVRDLTSIISEYCYNETDKVCPINEDTVDLCYKLLKKTTIAYSPSMFLNPKLHVTLANIESLAMDKESSEKPIDSTIPDTEAAHERLGNLKDRFKEVVCIYDKDTVIKRSGETFSDTPNKKSKTDEIQDFEELVRNQSVEKCTVNELKEYLKSVNVKVSGKKKADLIRDVYDLFNKA